MKVFIKNAAIGILVSFATIIIGGTLVWLFQHAWAMALFLRFWWTLPSALYTVGSFVWTIRAERLLRAQKREHRILLWELKDVRRELDEIQNFLENGNTIKEIKIIPLRKVTS